MYRDITLKSLIGPGVGCLFCQTKVPLPPGQPPKPSGNQISAQNPQTNGINPIAVEPTNRLSGKPKRT
jgi:hypothetical protein